MSLVALDNPPADAEPGTSTERSIRQLYALVEANLERVGGLDSAATLMRIDRGDLRRAIDAGIRPPANTAQSGRRYLAVDHLMRFGERVIQYSSEAAQRIATAFVRPMDLLVFPRVQMTAAEKCRRYEAMFHRMPLGNELMREALTAPESVFEMPEGVTR